MALDFWTRNVYNIFEDPAGGDCMKDKKFTQVSSTKGSEELLLWKDYSVYLFDEDINRDFVGGFILELVKSDPSTAENIVNIIERLQGGKGLQVEMIKGKKPKIKKVEQGDKLYELREYSSKLRKHLRVYFSVDSKNKKVVFLNACFKSDDKRQNKDIKVALSRYQEYFEKHK
jgi:hypothetical protein